MSITARHATSQIALATSRTPTRALLMCGIAVCPFFYLVATVQRLKRPGFDIRRHAISTHSLGDLGWIQIANFAITGALAIACAVGLRSALRRGRGATWTPILVGINACERSGESDHVDCRVPAHRGGHGRRGAGWKPEAPPPACCCVVAPRTCRANADLSSKMAPGQGLEP